MNKKVCCILLLGFFSGILQAETIDAGGELTKRIGTAGTANTVCFYKPFIKRNSGAMVTGLKSTNIRLYRAVEKAVNPLTATTTERVVGMSYSMVPTTSPVLAGLYNLCVKPVGFTWNARGIYTIHFNVKGTVPADNGDFALVLSGP